MQIFYSVNIHTKQYKYHSIQRNYDKRATQYIHGVGRGDRGTNIAPLFINVEGDPIQENRKKGKIGETDMGQLPLVAALIGAGIFLFIGGFILVIFIRYRRKQASPPPTPSGTITVMSTSTGQTRVISNAHIFTKDHLDV